MSNKAQRKNTFALSFARFRYTLLPENELYLPLSKRGHILRGAFGSSLRNLVCTQHKTLCRECPVKNNCPYFLIFSPHSMDGPLRLRDTPRGFVIKPSLEKEDTFTRDRPFAFDIVLFGNRIPYHPWILVPVQTLGSVGIGPRRDRFTIFNIEALRGDEALSIYDPNTRLVQNVELKFNPVENSGKWETYDRQKITLEFLTPTRIRYNPTGEKGGSKVVRVPEFHHLLKRLRDRINALAAVYGDGPLKVDFKGLGSRAEAVKIAESHISWVEIKRKSRTQGIWHDQSGFVGQITYTGHLEEFLPFLLMGEFVHVGEDAVFGNGWFRIVE